MVVLLYTYEHPKILLPRAKLLPLIRTLQGSQVWGPEPTSGRSANHSRLNILKWDGNFKIIKLNPIIYFSFDQMIAYLKENNVSYNKLHDQGFVSIGCAPYTARRGAAGRKVVVGTNPERVLTSFKLSRHKN